MDRDTLRLIAIGLLLIALVGGIGYISTRPPRLKGKPVKAWVVVKKGDIFTNGTIYQGPGNVEVHTVIRFENKRGKTWYVTDLNAFTLDGKAIGSREIKHWEDPDIRIRMIYFSVEPVSCYYEISGKKDLDGIIFKHFFLTGGEEMWRVDIPQGGKNYRLYKRPDGGDWAGEALKVGTLRFFVRVEFYQKGHPFKIMQSVQSAGKEDPDRATTVIAGLGKRGTSLFTLTSYCNLPGLGLTRGATINLKDEILDLIRRHIAYGTIAWFEILPDRGDPIKAVMRNGVVFSRGKPLKWGQSLHPGDLLSLPDGAIIFIRDDGDGLASAQDTVITKVKGPLAIMPLKMTFPDGTAGLFLSTSHEPSP